MRFEVSVFSAYFHFIFHRLHYFIIHFVEQPFYYSSLLLTHSKQTRKDANNFLLLGFGLCDHALDVGRPDDRVE
jgi:hypothetical protein